jgi:hypothetical protein
MTIPTSTPENIADPASPKRPKRRGKPRKERSGSPFNIASGSVSGQDLMDQLTKHRRMTCEAAIKVVLHLVESLSDTGFEAEVQVAAEQHADRRRPTTYTTSEHTKQRWDGLRFRTGRSSNVLFEVAASVWDGLDEPARVAAILASRPQRADEAAQEAATC